MEGTGTTHRWVGRAFVTFGPQAARGHLDLGGDTRVDLLDVYCLGCQHPYDAAADRRCPARTAPAVAARPVG
jgi:hypothetical protein